MVCTHVTEIDSGCMRYLILRIRDIVNQTPRHRLRSCCQSNTNTPAHIMLPCTVCYTVAARHHAKTIKPSVEILLSPPDNVPASRRLQDRQIWRRKRGRCRRWGGRVRAGATWMCAPLLYPVVISILFDLELWFEFYFFACVLPSPCRGAGRSFVEKVKCQYFMHPESISVI